MNLNSEPSIRKSLGRTTAKEQLNLCHDVLPNVGPILEKIEDFGMGIISFQLGGIVVDKFGSGIQFVVLPGVIDTVFITVNSLLGPAVTYHNDLLGREVTVRVPGRQVITVRVGREYVADLIDEIEHSLHLKLREIPPVDNLPPMRIL